MAGNALNDQGQAERQQKTVEMVESVKPLQKAAFDEDAENADDQRRDDQRRPIADARIKEEEIGRERPQHVLGAMGEVDDVEHAENDGESETEQRVKRSVDQPDEKLTKKRRRRNAEDF